MSDTQPQPGPDIRCSRGFYETFPRKWGTAPAATHYCAGCGHGIAHKLIAEALADLGLQDRAIAISPVGCAVFAYFYLDCGNIQAAHGRAPAIASALARTLDHPIIVSYQGDGDLGSIGFNQLFQAANRGERMAVFFINNAVYGMTGGQMAPTTLPGQRTTTSPLGRDVATMGYPLKVCEVLNALPAPAYLERCSLADHKRVMQARRAIRKALEIQRDGKGFALVELLSPCPTNMHRDPLAAAQFVIDELEKAYPLSCLRDRSAEVQGWPAPAAPPPALAAMFAKGAGATPPPVPDPTFGEIRIKLAGHGGQGVLSMGMILAAAAQKAGRYVCWFPSYGPEQRGGTANCSVVISGAPIGSPVVSRMDILVALNQPALERFAGDVNPGGVILHEAATPGRILRRDVRVLAAPATEMAGRCGVPKAMNTAMLGVLAASGICRLPATAFADALSDAFAAKPDLVAPNHRVLEAGLAWRA